MYVAARYDTLVTYRTTRTRIVAQSREECSAVYLFPHNNVLQNIHVAFAGSSSSRTREEKEEEDGTEPKQESAGARAMGPSRQGKIVDSLILFVDSWPDVIVHAREQRVHQFLSEDESMVADLAHLVVSFLGRDYLNCARIKNKAKGIQSLHSICQLESELVVTGSDDGRICYSLQFLF
jgi:hypothetical protein